MRYIYQLQLCLYRQSFLQMLRKQHPFQILHICRMSCMYLHYCWLLPRYSVFWFCDRRNFRQYNKPHEFIHSLRLFSVYVELLFKMHVNAFWEHRQYNYTMNWRTSKKRHLKRSENVTTIFSLLGVISNLPI